MTYPVADWRQASNYPRHKSMPAWRWEFVRRSDAYQDTWELHRTAPAHFASLDFGLGGRFVDPLQPPAPGVLPTTGNGGIVGLPTWRSVEAWRRAMPSLSDSTILDDVLHATSKAQEAGRVLVSIDPRLPLEPQLENFRRIHASLGAALGVAVTRRPHLGNWPRYCRTLDAIAAGAGRQEIARTLHPHRFRGSEASVPDACKAVDDDLDAARKLVAAFVGNIGTQ